MDNMEKKRFLFLRRLPKRSVLLLYVLCTMVAGCALVTLYLERDQNLPSTVHNILQQNNLTEEPPSATKLIIPPARSWSSLKDGNDKPLKDTTIDAQSSTKSTPINTTLRTRTTKPPRRRKKAFLDNTKYIYLTTNTSSTTVPSVKVPKVRDTCDSDDVKDTKLILLWTSFFGHWEYMPKDRFSKCARCRNCHVTRDRGRLAEADAVVFHARDMSLFDLPTVRSPSQRWVFYCLESPPYSDFPGLQHMRNMFNWTMTYRLDSDVVSQYGSVKRIRPPRPLDMSALRRSFLAKRASVAWLSSHCPTAGGRDAFVDELRRHIDVDVYGACGTLDCPKDSPSHCHKEFAADYKFLLAFENTVCKDYVTEKFYRALQFDIVPVVFGGATYERSAPPGSFVDALKFKSPRHLAFFLRGVGEDFDRYARYFEWRREYSVVLMNEKECGICGLLHDRANQKSSSYGDLRKWWVDGSECRTWEPKL